MLDVSRHLVCLNSHLGVHSRCSSNRGDSNVEPRSFVAEHHVERRRRRSLLVVPLDRDPVEIRATPQESLELNGVPVIVEVDAPVLGEESLEGVFRQRVGVRATGGEDHEVGDVHDSDAKLGNELAQEGGGGDDLERDFDAKTNENAVKCVSDEAIAL